MASQDHTTTGAATPDGAASDAEPSAAFTPGPWRAGGSLAVWQEAGGVVAQCYWVSGAIDVDVAEANARLIAAAPELYEALRLIRAEQREGYCCDATRAAADAALAKAEGK